MMDLEGDSPVGTAHAAGIERRARESAAYKAALEDQQPYERLAERMGTSRSVVSQLEDGQPASW